MITTRERESEEDFDGATITNRARERIREQRNESILLAAWLTTVNWGKENRWSQA